MDLSDQSDPAYGMVDRLGPIRACGRPEGVAGG
jgi:hypothetical protein